MNKKIIFPLFLTSLILVSCSSSMERISNFIFENSNLIALNKNSVKGVSGAKKDFVLVYKFDPQQLELLNGKKESEQGASFTVTLENGGQDNVKFSFLYQNDLESLNFLEAIDRNKPVSVSKKLEAGNRISISQIVNAQSKPVGFALKGTSVKLIDVKLENAKYGFDFCGGIPHYSFASSGGSLENQMDKVDFSAIKYDMNQYRSDLKLCGKLSSEIEKGPYQKQKYVSIPDVSGRAGKASFSRRVGGSSEFEIPMVAFTNKYPVYDVLKTDGAVKKLVVEMIPAWKKSVPPVDPIKMDLGLVFDYPVDNWRSKEYELFQWEIFPQVLLFDFADYKIQDQFFTRLAFFVEKTGYIGTLVSDEFILNNHGYNAHDYRAKDLAAFFTAVHKRNFRINEREEILRQILVKNGIIIPNSDGTYSEGKGSIISISQQSEDWLRRSLLAHECWHGVFFNDENFRNFVADVYNGFDRKSLEFIQTFWATQKNLGYDPTNLYLMHTEFMSYIMQNRFQDVGAYFLQIANRWSVNQIQGDQAAYIRETEAQAFVDASEKLNSYAYEKWGIGCGRINLTWRD